MTPFGRVASPPLRDQQDEFAVARRGFSADDIRKVLGDNVMRVFREVMGIPARTR